MIVLDPAFICGLSSCFYHFYKSKELGKTEWIRDALYSKVKLFNSYHHSDMSGSTQSTLAHSGSSVSNSHPGPYKLHNWLLSMFIKQIN